MVQKNYFEHEVKATENSTENNSNPLLENRSLYKTTSQTNIVSKTVTSPTTLSPQTTTTISKETDNHDLEPLNPDIGWPDFEEAIVKKVKKSQLVDESDILETNWLEDDWLDPNWNNYLSGDKDKQSNSQLSQSGSSVNFISPMINKKSTIETDSNVPRSRLYEDPKILEFRLKNSVALQNHTSEDTNGTSVRSGRPVFVYHRVTTSPQERRGNSAFIAVSVVRQSPAESQPTSTLPPLTFWDHIHRIQNPVKDPLLPKHQRKHPHWRQQDHRQHNRGRRHHHVQSHAHTHH